MRESIGGAWLFQLVIIFILLFVGFLCVAINYTRAFKVKNEIIGFIEREEGFTKKTDSLDGAVGLIGNYLSTTGYSTKGKCKLEGNMIGVKSLGKDSSYEVANKSTEYYYCIQKIDDSKTKAHYEIQAFFDFDLPIFGKTTRFKVTGETYEVNYPCDYIIWN